MEANWRYRLHGGEQVAPVLDRAACTAADERPKAAQETDHF